MKKIVSLYLFLILIVSGLLYGENLFEVRNSEDKPVLEVTNDGLIIHNPQIANDTLMVLTESRIGLYIDEENSGKGTKRSLSVASADADQKGNDNKLFHISGNIADNHIVDRPTMLWYPNANKNAFRVGYVSIESPAQVGINSFASGYKSIAQGNYSQALGYSAVATGNSSTSIGNQTIASGNYSTALGSHSKAIGDHSVALAWNSEASGDYSLAAGRETYATGLYSTSLGFTGEAAGEASMVIGANNIAYGDLSLAGGQSTQTHAPRSFAHGYFAKTYGVNSAAFGEYAYGSGKSSFATGGWTTAKGHYSTAMGFNIAANPYASTYVGRYNVIEGDSLEWVDTDPLFVVANGKSDQRNNALTVFKDGNVGIGGRNESNENHRLVVKSSSSTSLTGNSTPYSTAHIENTNSESTRKSMALHVVGNNAGLPMLVSQKGTGDCFRVDSYYGEWAPVFTITNQGQVIFNSKSIKSTSALPLGLTADGEVVKISSSKRYKKNIFGLKVDYNKFMSLKPVNFSWNEKSATPEKKDLGLIAEEVEKVDRSLAVYNEDGTIEGVDYQKINIMLLKVVQDQQKVIEDLQKRVEKLEGK